MPDDNVTRAGDKGLKAWQDAEEKRMGKRPEPDQYVQKVLGEEFEAIYTEGTEQHADVYEDWVPKAEKNKLQADLAQLRQAAEQKVQQVKQDYETKAENAVREVIKRYETKAEEDKKSYKEKDEHLSKREKKVKGQEDTYEDELQKAAKAAGVDIRPSLMRDLADDPVKAIVEVIEARQKDLAEREKNCTAMREQDAESRETLEGIRENLDKQRQEVNGVLDEAERLYFSLTGKHIVDFNGPSISENYMRAGVEMKKYVDGLLQRATELEKGEEEHKKKKEGLVTIAEKLKQKKEQLEEAQAKIDSERHDVEEGRAKYETDIKALWNAEQRIYADRVVLDKERELLNADREKLKQEKAAAGDLQVNYKEREAELEKRGADLKAAEELNRRKMKNLEAMADKLQKKEEGFAEKEKDINEQTDLLNLSYASIEQIVAKIRDFVGEVPDGDQDAYVTKFFEKVDGLAKYEERLKGQENDVNSLIEGVKARQAELDGREKAVTEVKGKLREANSALMDQVKTHAQKDKELKDREQELKDREEKVAKDEGDVKTKKNELITYDSQLTSRKQKVDQQEEEAKQLLEQNRQALASVLDPKVGPKGSIPEYVETFVQYASALELDLEKREADAIERNDELAEGEEACSNMLDKLKEKEKKLEEMQAKVDAERKDLHQQMQELHALKATQAPGTGAGQTRRAAAKAVKPKEPTKQVEPEEPKKPAKILVMEETEQTTNFEPYYALIQDEGDVRKVMGPYGLVEGKDYKFEKDGSGVKRTRVLTPEADRAWQVSQQPPEDAIEVEEEPAPKAPKKVAKKLARKPRGRK
jgi:chromosome segregation ATPase